MKFFKIAILSIFTIAATSTLSFSQTAANQAQTTDNIKTISVKVKGVGCEQDIKTIAANVKKLEGVISCIAPKKGTTTTFRVKMNPALVTEEAINAAIEGTAGCDNPNEKPYKIKL
ncbi:MAG: hypothetical protein AAF705_11415 [Bacteroidota bacterium]